MPRGATREGHMATLNNLNSTSVDTARDIGNKARHGTQTLSAKAQKRGQQISRRARSGLQKAQIGITVGSTLLQSLLHYNERKARQNQRKVIHQAHHLRNALQDTLRPAWSKTEDVIQGGLETTQDALQKSMKNARERLTKAQKNLERLEKASRERLESGWSAVQDRVEEGSQQMRGMLTRAGSNAKGSRQTAQKRHKHSRRKRSRALFRLGLVIGLALALLYTPFTGAEARQRVRLFWEQARQSFAHN